MSKLSLPSWEELAPRLAQNSYCPLPIERSEIELFGREHPAGGGWAYGLATPSDPEKFTAGVLCGRLLIEGGNRDEAIRTWIAVVKIAATKRDRAASLEAIVREHLGAVGPARLSHVDASVLLPFRISKDTNPRAFTGQTGLHIDGDNFLSVGSAGTCFLAAGRHYEWRDGESLVDVPRSQLPEITVDAVRPLILACEDFIQSQQPPAPKTERQLRLEARVAHRLTCGRCVLCADDVRVGDWVLVDGSDKHLARIVPNPNGQPVPDASGEFHIQMEGSMYRAHGYRLIPTAAPAPVEKPFEGEVLIGGFHRAPLTGIAS